MSLLLLPKEWIINLKGIWNILYGHALNGLKMLSYYTHKNKQFVSISCKFMHFVLECSSLKAENLYIPPIIFLNIKYNGNILVLLEIFVAKGMVSSCWKKFNPLLLIKTVL